MITSRFVIKPKQQLGKYRIECKLGEGGMAAVYRAYDTLEGVRVALKVPFQHRLTDQWMEEFRREIRINAQLHHPNILPVKNAEVLEGRPLVAYPLGERTLADRLRSRMSVVTAVGYVDQLLDAVAFAHGQNVLHCDIKPENLILFSDQRLMLSDFGLAKITIRTLRASGSGTIGYVAPEQAMGRPSFRSDVFSIGLVVYRMFSGVLPEWPYQWPLPGLDRLKAKTPPEMIELLRRSLELDPKKRFRDAAALQTAYRRLRGKVLRFRQRTAIGDAAEAAPQRRDWRTVRRRQFLREYGSVLETEHVCRKCDGPVSEWMTTCPWCGDDRTIHDGGTRMPQCCPRCERGMKLDWKYCPWCYGAGFHVSTRRPSQDSRYIGRCSSHACERKELFPFMRYCPWCRTKVRRKWGVGDSEAHCSGCGWGVLPDYWSFCPWCSKGIVGSG
ncbi:MAG TPA: hypothetical protein DCQ98_05870 [Planctomycetaceae bacterium]|nr:hypothetical protein [Planctomycetaceae bacterium]HRF01803.1 serine/threonine-protein kinase [Pirellulaceae bacterium]